MSPLSSHSGHSVATLCHCSPSGCFLSTNDCRFFHQGFHPSRMVPDHRPPADPGLPWSFCFLYCGRTPFTFFLFYGRNPHNYSMILMMNGTRLGSTSVPLPNMSFRTSYSPFTGRNPQNYFLSTCCYETVQIPQ